jgi:16S rRNA (guanine527-N7)-methyltransferase
MTEGAGIISKYFPELSGERLDRFARLGALYTDWNARVNLVSRKDIEHLYEKHVLHSLGIAKVAPFKSGMRVVDVGTGGGFPGVPLAILLPDVRFHLIDGTGKKIGAVRGVIEALDLKNATAEQVRSEEHHGRYDMIVSRAVTALPDFIQATRHLLGPHSAGIFYLKGGDLSAELAGVKQRVTLHSLSDHFKEEFFETKKVVQVAL